MPLLSGSVLHNMHLPASQQDIVIRVIKIALHGQVSGMACASGELSILRQRINRCAERHGIYLTDIDWELQGHSTSGWKITHGLCCAVSV